MRLKALALCALAAITGFSSGCTKSDWQRPAIEFGNVKGNSTVDIEMAGGSISITMKATRDWTIDNIQSWTGIDKENGQASAEFETITIAAPENPGYNRYANLVFKAGPIKEFLTIRQIGPDGEDDGIKDATVAQVISEGDKNQCYRITGTVSKFSSSYCSFDINDETGSIYVYSVTTATKNQYKDILKNGDTVTIEGYYDFYQTKSQHEIINASITNHIPAN